MEGLADQVLRGHNLRHDRVSFRSSSINPFGEALGVIQLVALLKRLKPTLVHCASPKGVLYGGIAARIAGVPCLVLAISGMGYAFTSTDSVSIKRHIIGMIYNVLARFAFGHKHVSVIVQNEDDLQSLTQIGWVKGERIKLIPGSGVELDRYPVVPFSERRNIVLFPARVLYDKGIQEFVEAAAIVAQRCPDWRFVIAGAADYDNPSAAPLSLIEGWTQLGFIDWLGHVTDMSSIFLQSKIVCLPSYREGMPKALLEAAAAGAAVVTTDVTGCRDAIEDGVTGELVPVRDARALARAIYHLIQDEERCKRYGEQGRMLAARKFSVESVIASTLKVYEELAANASGKRNDGRS
jgi:glycosyltransferase involved in cell wall biosynthesis